MATLDIFNNDAFSLSQLTQVIVDIPRVPTQIGDEGLFQEYGINTLSMMIERQGSNLKLVPTAPRGGVPEPVALTGRKLIPVAGVHLPQSAAIMADEVQGVRAFGTESEVDAVMNLVRRKAAQMKANLDLTLEYHRIGAIKGQVLDADGTSVLWNMYDMFGMTQQTQFFALATSTTDVKQKCVELRRKIQVALGGRPAGNIVVRVSDSFFDALVGHASVKKAYDLWLNGQFLRESQDGTDFTFAGVTFRPHSGGTSAGDFIPTDLGYAHPVGVPGMFQTAYCPANFMETVNTQGAPYYLKQERMKYDMGVELFSQTNPIHLCTLPEAVVKVSAAAS